MEAGFTEELKKVLLAHGCEGAGRGVWGVVGVWGSLRVWGGVWGDDGELLRRRESSFPDRKMVNF
jgi:hypothetical protein